MKKIIVEFGKYLGFFKFDDNEIANQYIKKMNLLSMYHFEKNISYKDVSNSSDIEIDAEMNKLKRRHMNKVHPKRKITKFVFIDKVKFAIDGQKILKNIDDEIKLRKKEIEKIEKKMKKDRKSKENNSQKQQKITNHKQSILKSEFDVIYYVDGNVINETRYLSQICKSSKKKNQNKNQIESFVFENVDSHVEEEVAFFLALKNIVNTEITKENLYKRIAIVCDCQEAIRFFDNINNFYKFKKIFDEDILQNETFMKNETDKNIIFNNFFSKNQKNNKMKLIEETLVLIDKLKKSNIEICVFKTKSHSINFGNILVDNLKYIFEEKIETLDDLDKNNYLELLTNEFDLNFLDEFSNLMYIGENELESFINRQTPKKYIHKKDFHLCLANKEIIDDFIFNHVTISQTTMHIFTF